MSDISSLGIGSGVLTADVIDQLKAADESRIVKPIENKISRNNQEQDAEKLLSSFMSTLKTSASALSYDTIFDKKNIDVEGNSAKVEIEDGAVVDSFTIETLALAKKNIVAFGALASKDATVANSGDSGTLDIEIDGKTFNIAYDDTTTLSKLAQDITEQAGDYISASIIQTGDGEYSLVLSSKETGANQEIIMTDSGDTGGMGDSGLLETFFDDRVVAQSAADSEFKFNDITITRSTNEIDDLILGVKIELIKKDETGENTSVNVEQDKDAITGEVQLFVDAYNTLVSNIHDMTLKDKETGAEGIFNGSSFVKSITQSLTATITAIGVDNDSLINYGIALDRNGTMSFDKRVLEKALDEDSTAVKSFFTGGTDKSGNEQDGIFVAIDSKIKEYTGYGKLLSDFENGLKTEGKDLEKTYLSAQSALDTRYEIMTKRFIAYDAIISKLNSQFASLQMMINADYAS